MTVSFIVLVSIVIHGSLVTPAMRHVDSALKVFLPDPIAESRLPAESFSSPSSVNASFSPRVDQHAAQTPFTEAPDENGSPLCEVWSHDDLVRIPLFSSYLLPPSSPLPGVLDDRLGFVNDREGEAGTIEVKCQVLSPGKETRAFVTSPGSG